MPTPQPREFRITLVSSPDKTTHGNLYISCESNLGRVSFWGSTGNMGNIEAIYARKHAVPFVVRCGSIPSNWESGSFWVPENQSLNFEDENDGIPF